MKGDRSPIRVSVSRAAGTARERRSDWNEGSVDCGFLALLTLRVNERLWFLAAGPVKPQQLIQVRGRL